MMCPETAFGASTLCSHCTLLIIYASGLYMYGMRKDFHITSFERTKVAGGILAQREGRLKDKDNVWL